MPLVSFTGEPQGREFIPYQEPLARYTWGGEDTRRGWGYPRVLPLSMRLRAFGPGANIGRKSRRGVDEPLTQVIPLETIEEAPAAEAGPSGGDGGYVDYGPPEWEDWGDGGWGGGSGGGGGGGGWTPFPDSGPPPWNYGLTSWRIGSGLPSFGGGGAGGRTLFGGPGAVASLELVQPFRPGGSGAGQSFQADRRS